MIFLLLFSSVNISNITAADDLLKLEIDGDNSNIPESVIEGITAEFIVKIINNGETNATEDIRVELKIDDLLVTTNSSSDDLPAGSSTFINLSWTPTYDEIGEYTLSIELYYEDLLMHPLDKPNFKVLERPTDLKITNIDLPDSFAVNKTAIIHSTIKNNGRNTAEPIYATLNSSIDGEVDTVIKHDSLPRNETCNFSFEWTPSHFGSQTISVDIVYFGETHDYEEKSVIVEIDQLQWWNESWHYRYFLTVNGSGNVSEFFNFTQFLEELEVSSQNFENDTLRIVEYSSDGDIVNVSQKYKFNESTTFNSSNNAIGTLIWNVTGPSFEKYYCIYFDVASNLGDRTVLNETDNITESGDASIGYYCFVDGWWIEVVEPINGSYCLIDQTVNITVNTTAMAENVVVEFYWNNSKINTTWLANVENNVSWGGNYTFTIEGNWKIRINSSDGAGYEPAIVEHAFYVGKPDIEIINITFTTDWSPTSPTIYKNDIVNITACLVAHNATVENVNVSLSIYDIENEQVIFNQTTITTIFVDEDNLVSFSWKANKSGDFNVTITLDPDNLIDEENESNNQITENITVYNLPDLEFEKIILPSDVTEFDKVKIDVIVVNKGDGNATNYKIGLYIEPVSQGFMTYTDQVNSELVSVNKNTSKQVSMYWDSAKPGEWYVAAKVIVNDTKRDPFGKNRLLSNETLKVKSIERNKPVIDNITVDPSRQEQGGPVTITAKVTDDSGLESVTIIITDPLRYSYDEEAMARTTGDEFKYVFDDTLEVGKYTFEIEAIDISIHKNNATKQGNFTIYEDKTPPVISYFDAQPQVQLKDKYVNITCVATDNIGIKSVIVFITSPTIEVYEKEMEYTPEGKYVYSSTYDTSGKYIFQIEVKDKAGNAVNTLEKTFWITSDLEDRDDDGMPDSWEEKYGLNPEDPNDAGYDPDGDGYTNLEEYKMGTNPTKDIFLENAAYRIKENGLYFAGSIVLFLMIILLSIFGKRRKLK